MKKLLALSIFLVATHAFAHSGHGRPGLVHFHEFSDGLLIVIALAVAALLYWMWKE